MAEYHSTATVLAALKSRFEDKSDLLGWIGIKIAAINREIGQARVLAAELQERGHMKRRGWWHFGRQFGLA